MAITLISTTARDIKQATLSVASVTATTGYLLVDRSQISTSALNPFPHGAANDLILYRLEVSAELTTVAAAVWNIEVGVISDITAASANVHWVHRWSLSDTSPLLEGNVGFGKNGAGINLGLREVTYSASDLAEAGTGATDTVATGGFTTGTEGFLIKYSDGAAAGLRRRITTVTDANNIVHDTFGGTAPADGDAFTVVYDTGDNFTTGNTNYNDTTFQNDTALAIAGAGPNTIPAVGDLVALVTETSGTETLNNMTLTVEYGTE